MDRSDRITGLTRDGDHARAVGRVLAVTTHLAGVVVVTGSLLSSRDLLPILSLPTPSLSSWPALLIVTLSWGFVVAAAYTIGNTLWSWRQPQTGVDGALTGLVALVWIVPFTWLSLLPLAVLEFLVGGTTGGVAFAEWIATISATVTWSVHLAGRLLYWGAYLTVPTFVAIGWYFGRRNEAHLDGPAVERPDEWL